MQRWMYFGKYLKDFDIEPIVITVDEEKASYRHLDLSFNEKVSDVEVYKTNTREPLKLYSRLISGNAQSSIPIGFSGESKPSFFQKISRAIRGNLFIPDSRNGWVNFAYKKAKEILAKEDISIIITTGPPHSTHLVGLKLKRSSIFPGLLILEILGQICIIISFCIEPNTPYQRIERWSKKSFVRLI